MKRSGRRWGTGWLHSVSLLSVLVLSIGLGLDESPGQTSTGSSGRMSGPWFFPRFVTAVGASASAATEAALLRTGIRAGTNQDVLATAQLLESFAAENPTSVWAPSLQANLGSFYFKEGCYTKALDQLQQAWDATKDLQAGPGKDVADFALVEWTQ